MDDVDEETSGSAKPARRVSDHVDVEADGSKATSVSKRAENVDGGHSGSNQVDGETSGSARSA